MCPVKQGQGLGFTSSKCVSLNWKIITNSDRGLFYLKADTVNNMDGLEIMCVNQFYGVGPYLL